MQEVKVKGLYKHYKGDLYIVEDIATHSETGEKMVIYRGLHGNTSLWARPYDMFAEKLSDNRFRFELQNIKSLRQE